MVERPKVRLRNVATKYGPELTATLTWLDPRQHDHLDFGRDVWQVRSAHKDFRQPLLRD